MRSIEIPQPEDRDWRYRAFEILPGALSWTVLAAPFLLSIWNIKLAVYFITLYIAIWTVRSVTIAARTLQGWNKVDKQRKLNWRGLNQDLENLTIKAAHAPKWHASNVERVRERLANRRLKPSEVIHAVFLALYKESLEVIEPTVQSLLANEYDTKKIILVIPYEQRGGPATKDTAELLVKKYKHHFYDAMAVMHPWPMTGEVAGKGGNITFAGRHFKKYLEQEKIDPACVLVTTLDADNRPDKKYFAALTYTFCSTEEPKYVSYQPIPMYFNNIWDAPAPTRVIATGTSFWYVVLSLRQHMARNFSSHAQPMAALIETDFWSVRSIVEDGHQFWRTYFRFDGRHEVYPIYVPIYQDAVLAGGLLKTLKAQFIQVRRWAWGASDVAYLAHNGFFKKNKVPKWDLATKFFLLLEGHVSWATMPLILLFAAEVPFLFDRNLLNSNGFIANQLPQVISRIGLVALVGLLVTFYLSFKSLPPKPARYKRHRTIWMVLQWVYLIPATVVFGALPALNSQTRLMFGWYLGQFDPTEKVVKK